MPTSSPAPRRASCPRLAKTQADVYSAPARLVRAGAAEAEPEPEPAAEDEDENEEQAAPIAREGAITRPTELLDNCARR